jgi:RecA/RadA recombinase
LHNILCDLLTIGGLNTLLFYNPYAKLCFTSTITSYFRKTTYLDFDTTYTAYTKSNLIKNYPLNNISLFTPNEGELESLITNIVSNISNSSLLIIDSLNSFYNLYYHKIDMESLKGISTIQHTLSNFLMILLKFCQSLRVPILVTNMMRYRKKEEWIKTPTNKRFLQKKSAVMLFVELLSQNMLFLDIITHPTLLPTTLTLDNNNINII